MARQLIESLSTEFDPSKYRDEYREAVLEMIERKAQGEEISVQAPEEEPAEVPDLMAALEASIASAKRQGGSATSGGAKGKAKPKPKGKGKAESKSSNGRKRSTAKK